MRPGHEDRENPVAGDTPVPVAKGAAMRPGHEDRENATGNEKWGNALETPQ